MTRSVVLLAAIAGCSGPPKPAPEPAPAGTAPAADPAGPPAIDHAAGLRAHIEFLADDLLEGRGTGTRGYDIAARYAVAQLRAAGAAPAGIGGTYLQPMPLHVSLLEKASMVARIKGKRRALAWVDEFIASGEHTGTDVKAAGEVVFAGFGVVAPRFGIDDYAGVDAAGKVVLMLIGAPAQLPTEARAHHTSTTQKLRTAKARGAAAVLFVHSLQFEKVYPYDKMKADAGEPSMTWIDAAGAPFVDVPLTGALIHPSVARDLFAAAGKSFDDVRRAADATPARTESFAIGASIDLRITSAHERAASANVVAAIPGSDPELRDEHVLITAHLDHLGIDRPVDGDSIYNGAQDNATGSAMVLELARALAADPPRRSVMLALVTAEEKGLVGSDYLARHPTTGGAIVANINLDLVIMTPDKKLVFWGDGNSSLGPIAREVAEASGFGVMPDPMPEQVYFVRSDHYSFVKQGVPALFLGVGFDNGGAGVKRYLPHYHKPSDQVGTVEIDYRAGARLVALVAALTAAIASADERPRWNDGDFFGELYGGG
jgi:Zn-dependent M28 family amino/carboxypeptidase